MDYKLTLSDPVPEIYQRLLNQFPRVPAAEPNLLWSSQRLVLEKNHVLRMKHPSWPDHLLAVGERAGGLEVYAVDVRYPGALVRTLPGGNPGSGFGREALLPTLEDWLAGTGQATPARTLRIISGQAGRPAWAFMCSLATLIILFVTMPLLLERYPIGLFAIALLGVCTSIFFLNPRRFWGLRQLGFGMVFFTALWMTLNAFFSGFLSVGNAVLAFLSFGLPAGKFMLQGSQPNYPCRNLVSFKRPPRREGLAWSLEEDLFDYLRRMGYKPTIQPLKPAGQQVKVFELNVEGEPIRLHLERADKTRHLQLYPKPGFKANVLGHISGHAYARLSAKLHQYLQARGDVFGLSWYRENPSGLGYDFGHHP